MEVGAGPHSACRIGARSCARIVMRRLASRRASSPDYHRIMADAIEDQGGVEPTFGLDEMLHALRRDLVAANEALDDGVPILNVGGVEVEVAFSLERTSEKSGGVNFKIFGVGVEGGGKGATGRTYANRVKLTLTPSGAFGVAGTREAGS